MGIIFQRNKLKNFKSSKAKAINMPDIKKVTNEIANCRVVVTDLVNHREYKNSHNPEVVKIKPMVGRNTWMGR